MGGKNEQPKNPTGAELLEQLRADAGPNLRQSFEADKEWNGQVITFLERCMREKYGSYAEKKFKEEGIAASQILPLMMADKDFTEFVDDVDDGSYIEFRPGTLKLAVLENDNTVVGKFELEPVLKNFLERILDDKIRMAKQQVSTAGYHRRAGIAPGIRHMNDPASFGGGRTSEDNAGTTETGRTDDSSEADGNGGKTSHDGSPTNTNSGGNIEAPVIGSTEEINPDLLAFYKLIKRKRDNVLTEVRGENPKKYGTMDATLHPQFLQNALNDDPNVFSDELNTFQNFLEIDKLINAEYRSETGFTVNPFSVSGFTLDTLRTVIREEAEDGVITFEDIETYLFSQNTDAFKKTITKLGVKEETYQLIDGHYFDDEDLLASHKKLREVSKELEAANSKGKIKNDDLKKLYAHKDEIKIMINVLEDYIVSITTLMNYLQSVEPNVGKKNEGEKTMYNDGAPTARALRDFFIGYNKDVALEKYDFEESRVNFRDLNGNVALVEGSWFNNRQSPDTAYKLAYESAQGPLTAENNWAPPELDENSARIYLNYILNLGIGTVSTLRPKKKSIRSIMDSLHDAGVTVPPKNELITYKGDTEANVRMLYAALALNPSKNLHDDLLAEVTEADIAKKNARSILMRLGSVVNQKEEENARRERIVSNKMLSLKLKPEQVQGLMKNLRTTGKFTDEELLNIEKSALVGIALVLNITPDSITDVVSGVGLFKPIDLGHDVTLTVGGGIHEWNKYSLGAGIGTKYNISKGMSVNLSAGAGVNFGEGTQEVIAGPNASVRLTKELENCDLYIEAGVAAGFGTHSGQLFPGFNAAVGYDRTNQAIAQDYKERIEKIYSTEGIDVLDKLDPAARYKEVSEHIEKYPGLGEFAVQLKSSRPPLRQEVQVRVFNDTYEMFKEQSRNKSREKAVEGVVYAGLKVGITTTVMPSPIPPFFVNVPTPNIGLEFNVWDEKLTYISATPEEKVAAFNAEDLMQKLRENEAKKGAAIQELTVSPFEWSSSGKLIYVPGPEGKGRYAIANIQAIDFTKFITKGDGNFERFQAEIGTNAGLSVVSAESGLLTLAPHKAHGEIEVYTDPQLPKGIHVVPHGGELMFSAPNNQPLYVVRADTTFPIKNRGEVERSVIIISHRTDFDMRAVEGMSEYKLYKVPEHDWTIQRVNAELSDRDTNDQAIVSYEQFSLHVKPALPQDRLQPGPKSDEEYQNRRSAQHKELMSELTYGQAYAPPYEVSPKVQSFINKFKSDLKAKKSAAVAIAKEFKTLVHDRYILGKNPHLIKERSDIYELDRAVNTWINGGKLGAVPNPEEFAFVIRELTDATFTQIQNTELKNRPAVYKRMFERYHLPMFLLTLKENKNPPFNEGERNEVEILLKENLATLDFEAPPKVIADGTVVSQDVGTYGSQGEATYIYSNPRGSRQEGVLSRLDLKPGEPGIRGKLAQYIILKHSKYQIGLTENIAADAQKDLEANKKTALASEFRTPFAQRAFSILGALLTDVEMAQVIEFVKNPKKYELNKTDKDVEHSSDTLRVATILKVSRYLDTIRTAELAGTEETQLETGWKLRIYPKPYIGAYSVCTNYIKALEDEVFVLAGETSKTVHITQYGAALTEGSSIIEDIRTRFKTYSIVLGLAIPIPKAKEVTTPKEEEREGPTPPPGEVPPPPPPPPTPPPPPPESVPPESPVPNAGTAINAGGNIALTPPANDSTGSAGAQAGWGQQQ